MSPLLARRGRGDVGERPGAFGHPFAVDLAGDPGDVVFEGRGGSAVGALHAGDFAGHVYDGDVADVADTLDGAEVGGAGHGAGLFSGEELFDLGRAFGVPAEGVDHT